MLAHRGSLAYRQNAHHGCSQRESPRLSMMSR
jgi:hypothetical protein